MHGEQSRRVYGLHYGFSRERVMGICANDGGHDEFCQANAKSFGPTEMEIIRHFRIIDRYLMGLTGLRVDRASWVLSRVPDPFRKLLELRVISTDRVVR
ncbi:hypothetical protein JXB02_01280 [Candidatus Woesearchaeota archaeon]|nr:hypothetical protein [Candidatus Woesearchaeota archaeon]